MNMRQARNDIRYECGPSTAATAEFSLKFVPTSRMSRMNAFLVFGEEKWHRFLLTLTDLPGFADLVVPSRTGLLRGVAEVQLRLVPRPSLALPKIR